MKILFILHQFNPRSLRGVELQCLELARHYSKEHVVKILTTYIWEDNITKISSERQQEYSLTKKMFDNIEIIYINQNKSFTSIPELTDEKKRSEINTIFRILLDSYKPDIVHFQHLKNLSLDLPSIAKEKGIPAILSIYDYFYLCPKIQMIDFSQGIERPYCDSLDKKRCSICAHSSQEDIEKFWRHDKDMISSCDKIFMYSSNLKREYQRFGIYPQKIRFINASHFDPKRFLDIKKKPAKTIRFGYIGTIGKHKGIEPLLKAWKKIDDSLPDNNAKLTIYGSTSTYANVKEYYDLLESRGLMTRNIDFVEEVPYKDVHKIYEDIDYLIFPSLWQEPSPRTMQEAFLTRTPIICSNIQSIYERIHPKALTLFKAGSDKELTDILSRIIKKDQKRSYPKDKKFISYHRWYTRQFVLSFKKVFQEYRLSQYDKDIKISIIIPIKDPSPTIYNIIQKISKQNINLPYELVIIDSSSDERYRQKIISLTKKLSIKTKYINIRPTQFNHGLSRDKAAFFSSGKYLVYLTQDALPSDNIWLSSLIDNFRDNKVACVWSRQVPRKDTKDKLEIAFTKTSIAGQKKRRISYIQDQETYKRLTPEEKYDLCTFENVSCAIRKDIWFRYKFEKHDFGEDIAFAKKVIEDNHSIIFEPDSIVYHSHKPRFISRFKRWFLSSVIRYSLFTLLYVPSSNIYESIRNSVIDNKKSLDIQDDRLSTIDNIRIYLLSAAEVLGSILSFYYIEPRYKYKYLFSTKDKIKKIITKNGYIPPSALTSTTTHKGTFPALFLHPASIYSCTPKKKRLWFNLIYGIELKAINRYKGINYQVFITDKNKEKIIYEDSLRPSEFNAGFKETTIDLRKKRFDKLSFVTLPMICHDFQSGFNKIYGPLFINDNSILEFSIVIPHELHGTIKEKDFEFKIIIKDKNNKDDIIYYKKINKKDTIGKRYMYNEAISLKRYERKDIYICFRSYPEKELKKYASAIWHNVNIVSRSYHYSQARHNTAAAGNDYNWAYIINPIISDKKNKDIDLYENLRYKILNKINRWCIG